MPTDDLTLRMRATGARNTARDVDRTRQSVDRFGRSTRKTGRDAGMLGRSTGLLSKPFRHLREEAFSLAKGVAAAGLAFGSVEGIKRSIDTTDTLVKTTVRLRSQFGLTTQSASGLAAVLQARDLQPQGLTMGLVALSKQLVQAEHGSKMARGAFRIFGLDARGVHKALNTRDGLANVFQTVVDRLTQMHGGARKAALGQQLLGRASRGLAPLLQEGALGLKQQLKWAKEYGVTLDGKTVGSVEDMAAAQTQAQYAMLGLQIQIGRFAAPAVAKANVTLAQIVKGFRDGRPEGNKFARTVHKLGMDLIPVGKFLGRVGGYLRDHPRLLRAAAVAYVAYRLKLLKLISIAPLAYAKGLIAGRMYSAGFERGSLSGRGRASLLGVGRGIGRLVGLAAGVLIASEIAQALHQSNMDPLSFLHPDSAGGRKRRDGTYQDTIPRRLRRRGTADPTVAYFRAHRRELTPAVVSSLSGAEQRALGVTMKDGQVIHLTVTSPIYIEGKPVAKVVRRQAVKAKATG